jgi:bacillithiol system protein YtxJ
MNVKWNKLESIDQLSEIQQKSKEQTVLIFKHSTRCSISRAALDRFERNWNNDELKNITPYFLDLISNREISNRIAADFEVQHESPQVLLIRNGQAIYDRSHFDIDMKSISAFVADR